MDKSIPIPNPNPMDKSMGKMWTVRHADFDGGRLIVIKKIVLSILDKHFFECRRHDSTLSSQFIGWAEVSVAKESVLRVSAVGMVQLLNFFLTF